MDVQHRPLLATADPLLLDDLLRLATAASTEVAVAHTLARALSLWARAPLVVVGADLHALLRSADPPPGRHVIVTRDPRETAAAGNPSGDAPRGAAAPRPRVPPERYPPDVPAEDSAPGVPEASYRPGTPSGRSSPGAPAEAYRPGPAAEHPASGTRAAGDRPDVPVEGPAPDAAGEESPRGSREARVLLLPRDEALLVDLLARASYPDRAPAPTVSVVGGRGGAGASLLAVAIALAGERAGRSTALLDADPFGCGSDVYLGCDRGPSPGPERWTGWGDLLRRRGRVRWRDLRAGLPGTSRVSVLTWTRGREPTGPLPVGVVRAVLSSAGDGTDLVVADLPRSFDPATTVFLNRSDLVLVVVPADVPSVVAATRTVARLREETRTVRLVVRGARGELSADVVSRTLKVDLGADLPSEPGLARSLAAGDVPARHHRSPLARFADRVVAGLPATGKLR
ncbi:septum site-determining protein Ssd [Nocardiopsis sp. RV163]|uniref:septum site-determining protein Ssd n=1 Tax=Nocardiopsis sp. RV163 TaxID=1661388 RepID=UPI00064BE31A|nr:septum site-determining protein Ssd [Nocardiopsis sp. RV163]